MLPSEEDSTSRKQFDPRKEELREGRGRGGDRGQGTGDRGQGTGEIGEERRHLCDDVFNV